MNWKDPAVAAKLRELWTAGHSCSAIALLIGAVSRNAVIGAVRRQNLPFRGYRPGGVVAKHITNPKKSRSQAMGGKIARKKGKPFVFGNKAPSVSPMQALRLDGLPIPPPAETDIPRVSFRDLNEDGKRHCKWCCLQDPADVPQDQPMFCGLEPVQGLSYCRDHAMRAFQPPKPRPPEFPMTAPVVQQELEAA